MPLAVTVGIVGCGGLASSSGGGGNQQPQLATSQNSVSFGNVVVGNDETQPVTLTNSGDASLTVSQVTLSGSGFSMVGLTMPLTLAAGQSSSFTLEFSPQSAGNVTGSVTIASNAPGSPMTIPLSGTGVAATRQLTAGTTSLNFGNVNVDGSSSQTVPLTNSGNSDVNISQVNISGTGFSSSGLTPPLTLTPGQTTTLTVAFAPTSGGGVTGGVSVLSNATNSPATINLSGTGVHWVSLSWVASTSIVVGYNLYRGTQSGGPYTKLNSSLITTTSYTDTANVQPGQTYYYVATSVDSNNNESAHSNEISVIIPTP